MYRRPGEVVSLFLDSNQHYVSQQSLMKSTFRLRVEVANLVDLVERLQDRWAGFNCFAVPCVLQRACEQNDSGLLVEVVVVVGNDWAVHRDQKDFLQQPRRLLLQNVDCLIKFGVDHKKLYSATMRTRRGQKIPIMIQ